MQVMAPETGKSPATVRRVVFLLALFYVPLVCQAYYNILMSTYFGKGYPKNTSLFRPEARFGDFTPLYLHGALFLRGGNPYTDENLHRVEVPPRLNDLPDAVKHVPIPQVYFPLANPLAAVFALLPYKAAFVVYLCIVIFGGIGALILQARWFIARHDRGLFLAMAVPFFLLCYPMIFMLDRGNWEGFVALLVWYYLLSYKKKAPLAWVLLGVVSVIKPQTALLGFLPLLDRDWRQGGKTVLLGAALGAVSLAVLPGPFWESLLGVPSAINWFYHTHLWEEYTIRFCHTLFGFMKGLSFQIGGPNVIASFKPLSSFLSIAVMGAVLSALWRAGASVSLERRALALVVMLVTLPHLSFDYTLVELLPVFFLILGNWLRGGEEGDFALLLLVCLILAPKQFGVGTHLFPYGPAYLINTPLLLALLYFSVKRVPAPTSLRVAGPVAAGV